MSVEITGAYIIHNLKDAWQRGGPDEAARQAIDWQFYRGMDARELIQDMWHPIETWFTDSPPAQCQCDYCKTERDYIGG